MYNAFYIADIVSKNTTKHSKPNNNTIPLYNLANLSKYTIFTIATMDWLMHYRHSSKQYMRVLHSYYEDYKAKSHDIYGKGFANWLSLGAKWYRVDYEADVAIWSSVIANKINNMRELKRVLSKIVRATSNTIPALRSAEMICTTIYHINKRKTKNQILKYLEKHYNYTPCNNLDKYIENFQFTTNAYENTEACLNCYFLTNSTKEALHTSLQFNYNRELISTTSSILAEADHNDVPEELITHYYKKLPTKYKNIIQKFKRFNYDKLTKR
ncbi:MAG: hypothetical protein E7361_00625 [Clostridiales bacterium]|nr:hypothetical protein [Clostridiales bacterium]